MRQRLIYGMHGLHLKDESKLACDIEIKSSTIRRGSQGGVAVAKSHFQAALGKSCKMMEAKIEKYGSVAEIKSKGSATIQDLRAFSRRTLTS